MTKRRTVVLALMACLTVLPAAATEVKFNLLSIEGLVVGKG